MSRLFLYSDDPSVVSAVGDLLPNIVPHPLAETPSRPTTDPTLVIRRSEHDAAAVPTHCSNAGILVAALRSVGLSVRWIDSGEFGTELPFIELPRAGDDAGIKKLAVAIKRWWDSRGSRSVMLAAPRSACAGVDRAVDIVELALARFGPPVYVRKQIVHNDHIVAALAARGAVFVDSVEEAPEGAVLVFSAHGVSPAVRAAAMERRQITVDATCPLVGKVHSEVRHHVGAGRTIAYIGHAGHEESDGLIGEAPESIRLVETTEDVERLEVDDAETIAFLTQTTLAVDEVDDIVAALRRRFPDIKGPRGEDICYATTNRQRAVRAIAAQVDLMLVVGSRNSSNANRLVEVASRAGAPAVLVEDVSALDPALLRHASRIGITAAASTPEQLVERLVDDLRCLGQMEVEEVRVAREDVSFTLPASLRENGP